MLDLLELCEDDYRDGYLRGALTKGARAPELPEAGPRISVLLPTYEPPLGYLRRAIASVRRQRYANWQLVLADDASRDPAVRALLAAAAADEPRIEASFAPTHGHIVKTTNRALAGATGAYVTFLDQDDELAPDALALMAQAIARHPQAGLLYSDEDRIDPFGACFLPYFKPAWSPDLLTSQNYICHLAVYEAGLLRRLDGLREGYEGSQDHDLALRASRALLPHQIVHVPHVCYHWRTLDSSTATHGAAAKPYALAAGVRALADHLAHAEPGAEVLAHRGFYRVRRATRAPTPRVRLVALADGEGASDGGPDGTASVAASAVAAAAARGWDAARVELPPGAAAHPSGAINRAATPGQADVVLVCPASACLPNADVLAEALALLRRQDVGFVAFKLADAAGTVASIGQVLSPPSTVLASHAGWPVAADGYFGRGRQPHLSLIHI